MISTSTTTLRNRLAASLVVAALATGATPSPAADPAEAMVRSTADAVLAILRDDSLDSEAKQAKLEVLLVANADFATISKLVLARNWTKLAESDREEFQVLFRRYLTATYGRNVDEYSDEDIEILGSREEARGDRTVSTKVVRNGPDDLLVDYRLRQFDGNWKIIDVVAEGVSMVSNLRSQFQEIVSQGGTEKLMKILREKSTENVAAAN
jgi:phospholipid transport system substrate-binding protein